MKFPRSGKKVFICYKVIIKFAQEVETNSLEVEKGIDLVEGYFQR